MKKRYTRMLHTHKMYGVDVDADEDTNDDDADDDDDDAWTMNSCVYKT